MRNPSHPGRVVRDLGFVEGTQPAAIAEQLGLDLAELQPVLDGHAPMTPSLGLALEAAGISNASFWMRLQGSYDLAQERLRREREQGNARETELEAGLERETAAV